ncbi:conserved hypothetical protein (plasmid) [Cupriavidus taiwanensis LMG 19424]|nr:hypothetical protein A9P79_29175 [Cupriavidus taiwanensis]CAP63712.1 conserved hypothetical protein [Cupriavidus taiwanensis LMG 19424]SOZ75432.1 conserved hypothetical protein [Cupriavidus taiwanensis]
MVPATQLSAYFRKETTMPLSHPTPANSTPQVQPPIWVAQHVLERLLDPDHDPVDWIALSAIEWLERLKLPETSILEAAKQSGFPELYRPLNRYELLDFCARTDVPFKWRFAAMMAFGGRSRRKATGCALWACVPAIEALAKKLPTMTRRQAYRAFRYLIASAQLEGMGPSFFTKVMFFFGCSGAYILDQWLAKSILALNRANWTVGADGEPVFAIAADNYIRLVAASKPAAIDRTMTEDDYEKYCLAVESLVAVLGRKDGADTERWLFSQPQSAWRRFLAKLSWKRPDRRLSKPAPQPPSSVSRPIAARGDQASL